DMPHSLLRSYNYIGAGSSPTNANAIIDEVRIWNVARTQREILDNMNHKLTGHEAGLASYWEMDEPSNSAPTTFDATKDFEYALLSPPISRVVSTAPVSPPGN